MSVQGGNFALRKMGWFNGWFGTPWYAMLYSHRDEEDAAILVEPLVAKGALRPGDKVLDLACGRGRHAAVFDRLGLEVTGLDLSRQSIREAKQAMPNAHFEVFDIREPYAINTFDAAVCLFTSLGYSNDREDDQLAVNAATKALKPGGLFVLDLLNGRLAAGNLVRKEQKVINGVRFDIRRKLQGDDIVKQITVNHTMGQEEYEERVHAWSLPEVQAMLAKAGLDLQEATDCTCLRPFDAGLSDRMVLWAKKPE